MSSDANINMHFYEFGKKMKIVAIMVILMIIPYAGNFLMLIGWIFAILALQNIQSANFGLKNTDLEEFRSKYYIALIFYIISSVVGIVGLFFPLNLLAFMLTMNFVSLIPAITISVITFILNFIGAIIEYSAWGKLEFFFNQNGSIFPPYLAKEATDGAHNLKNGALMYILFFLFVTILIGWIFRIIGYFKLAKLEQMMSQPGVVSQPQLTMTTTQAPTQAPTQVPSGAGKNFCPNCGAEVKGAGKFCGECGSPLE
jgi:uncharacterized membrane protein